MGLVLAGGMGFANADVKLYGQLDMSIDATDFDGGDDDINMGSNRSAIGFKGAEDLGNGLSAFFKVEYQTDLDDEGFAGGTNEDDTNNNKKDGSASNGATADGWKSRDQYIGLKMKRFGKLTFGQMSTAYKSPASKLDPFYRTRNQARNVGLQSTLHKGKGEDGQGRATNTVRYDSPKFMGGAKVFGTYTFDNNDTDADNDDPFSIGTSYKAGNIYAFASYITTQQSGDNEAMQAGAKYTWNDASFWGIYELDKGMITKIGAGSKVAADDGADVWSVGASYTIGNNLVSFDYGQGDSNDVVAEYTTWRLGGQHKFSNRTKVYATFSEQDFDENDLGGGKYSGELDIFSLGMRHNF